MEADINVVILSGNVAKSEMPYGGGEQSVWSSSAL